SQLPIERTNGRCVSVGTSVYLWGGVSPDDPRGQLLLRYDPGGDSFANITHEVAELPARAEHPTVFPHPGGTGFYFWGGRSLNEAPYTDKLFLFNIGSGTWSVVSDSGTKPTSRSEAAAFLESSSQVRTPN